MTRATPARWQQAAGGHDYGWHDGRLHALATVALPRGVAYVGRWTIPVLVNGRLSSISGGLWHADDPSIVWFWPIIVVLSCVLAARRLRRRELDVLLSRVLAGVSLAGIAVAGVGRELHGRPSVSVFQLVTLVLVGVFVAWGSRRVLVGRTGYFAFYVIAAGAVWAGPILLPTLFDGFVLMAVPAFVARVATVVCFGCGAGLVALSFRLADYRDLVEQPPMIGLMISAMRTTSRRFSTDPVSAIARRCRRACAVASGALMLAGCGSAGPAASSSGLPAALVAQARPIRRGARFHPPATGPLISPCRRRLGRRFGVHVELFAANGSCSSQPGSAPGARAATPAGGSSARAALTGARRGRTSSRSRS